MNYHYLDLALLYARNVMWSDLFLIRFRNALQYHVTLRDISFVLYTDSPHTSLRVAVTMDYSVRVCRLVILKVLLGRLHRFV